MTAKTEAAVDDGDDDDDDAAEGALADDGSLMKKWTKGQRKWNHLKKWKREGEEELWWF